MPKRLESVDIISEICVDPQPGGLTAVYLVETRSEEEAREIGEIFAELESCVQVRALCKGKLMSFAVQADQRDVSLLDDLEDILRTSYGFVVTHRSFDSVIYRIVEELSKDTGSKLMPVPRCDICSKEEPFPNTVISLTDADGLVLDTRSYCASCTAKAAAPNNKEFVRALLNADKRNFGRIERAELVRHPSRRRSIRFKVKAEDLAFSG